MNWLDVKFDAQRLERSNFARDFQGGLSITEMQRNIEEELENHLAGEIEFYEALREALQEGST